MISARKIIRALCLVLTSLVLSAFAAPAGDFSGTFTAPVAAGKGLPITISHNVANNTSSDISNAAIAMHEPTAGPVTYEQLNSLSLPAGADTRASGSFTVPQGIYKSWQKSSFPAMSVSFRDVQGSQVRSLIQL